MISKILLIVLGVGGVTVLLALGMIWMDREQDKTKQKGDR